MTGDAPATVVLVHGAWHGSWCWADVIPLLSGHDVVTVDLLSVGDAAQDVHADAKVLRDAVSAIDGPVIVVAHSFGGVVASQALAGLSNVVHLLYLASFVLDVGESLLSAAGGTPPPWWRVGEDGLVHVDAADAREVFFNDLPDEPAQAAVEQLRPHSFAAFSTALSAAAWRDIPASYVVATRDNAIPVFAQRKMAARCGAVYEVDSSHSPFLSHPEFVADLIRTAGSAPGTV